jgi:ribonucleoside-diphosphate reductase alpha chain
MLALIWILVAKDIISVQYQNANNSVRVSDEFMRAYEKGESVWS